jgi:hypothetical protein
LKRESWFLQFRDRIDGWWNLKFHPQDYSKASLGRQKQKATPKTKPSEGKNRRHRGSHAIRVPKKSLTPPTSS